MNQPKTYHSINQIVQVAWFKYRWGQRNPDQYLESHRRRGTYLLDENYCKGILKWKVANKIQKFFITQVWFCHILQLLTSDLIWERNIEVFQVTCRRGPNCPQGDKVHQSVFKWKCLVQWVCVREMEMWKKVALVENTVKVKIDVRVLKAIKSYLSVFPKGFGLSFPSLV